MTSFKAIEIPVFDQLRQKHTHPIKDQTLDSNLKSDLRAYLEICKGLSKAECSIEVCIVQGDNEDNEHILKIKGTADSDLLRSFVSRTTRFQFKWGDLDSIEEMTREKLLSFIINSSNKVLWTISDSYADPIAEEFREDGDLVITLYRDYGQEYKETNAILDVKVPKKKHYLIRA